MIGGPHRVLLLHGEGWDDLIMVGLGLVLAWVVISVSGRRRPTDVVDAEQSEGPKDSALDERLGGTSDRAR